MQSGFIDWFEFEPQGDTFIVKSEPDNTKKETESGIIVTTENSVIQDRPANGTVVSVGPEANFEVNEFVYFEPTAGFDLKMIRTENDETYLLLYNKSIIGKKVKDTRN